MVFDLIGQRFCLTFWLVACMVTGTVAAQHVTPLALHPKNGHYFLYRGRAMVAIGSGEHYGAVLNADFNFEKYLRRVGPVRVEPYASFQRGLRRARGGFPHCSEHSSSSPGSFFGPLGTQRHAWLRQRR